MKRCCSILIIFSLLLSGCSAFGTRIKEPVNFYYVRSDYSAKMDSVVSAEVREASGHRYDLSYLLALYSMGPSEKNLIALFPKNTVILPVEHSEAGLVLSIQDDLQTMTDAEYTLASACLAMTCMELIDAEQVTVISANRSITINEENLMLTGSNNFNVTEDGK